MAKKKAKKVISQPPPSELPTGDDDGLLDDLAAQLDDQSTDSQTAATVVSQVDHAKADELEATARGSKDRWKARQLRKDAEKAAQYTPDNEEAEARRRQEIDQERNVIMGECEKLGLIIHEVNPDGHCLYSAIADQLKLLDIVPAQNANHIVMRDIAATYIERNKDFFLPFLPCMNGEDGMGAERSGLMSENDFQSYCQNVRSSSLWGGQPEITALSNAYNVPIRVIQWGDPVQFITDPGNSPGLIDEKRVVNISYHRRMYGLGEHYNSLRPKSIKNQLKELMR